MVNSQPAPMAEENLAHTSWRHDAWLAGYPLIPSTVLDYFALSPFYERNCNNEKARMQGLDPSKLATLGPGMEYVVHLQDCQPPHLFTIIKQLRKHVQPHQGPSLQVQAVYYVLDGTIYQAPTLHAALHSRMKRCLHNIKLAFSTMKRDLDPLVQGQKLLATEASKPAKHLQRAAAASQQLAAPSTTATMPLRGTAPSKEQIQAVGKILFNVMESFPLPNAVQQVQLLAKQAYTAATTVATDAGTSNQLDATAAPPSIIPTSAPAAAAAAVPQPDGGNGRDDTPSQPVPKRIKLTLKREQQ